MALGPLRKNKTALIAAPSFRLSLLSFLTIEVIGGR